MDSIGGEQPAEPVDGAPILAETVRRRRAPVAAWVVIIALVLAIFSLRQFEPALKPAPEEDLMGRLNMRLMGRYYIGASSALPDDKARQQLLEQAKLLDTGTIGQRLQFVALMGELGGPAEALKALHALQQKLETERTKAGSGQPAARAVPSAKQAQVMKILERLYENYEDRDFESATVTADERDLLRAELGWFGDLALAPKTEPVTAERQRLLWSAQFTMFGVIAVFGGFAMLALGGFAGLVLLLVLATQGQLRGGIVASADRHGIYAETFAWWMVLFLVLSGVAGVVGRYGGGGLWVNLIAFFLSLAALGWPVLRGIPWHTVRQDIGWTPGRLRVLEPLTGLAGYAMSVPILIAGVMMTLLLVAIATRLSSQGVPGEFDPTVTPMHPVVHEVASGGWPQWLQILLLASVAAPIVEETMFRGVLYAHLRGATQRFGTAASVFASVMINGLLFAAIHPQGLLAVPALTAIAIGFSLTREWRGSLIPSMVAHSVNNSAVMALMILLVAE